LLDNPLTILDLFEERRQVAAKRRHRGAMASLAGT